MYVRVEDWRAAHRVAVGCMPPDEIRELYVAQVPLPFFVTSLRRHSATLKTFRTKTFSSFANRLARHSLCDLFKPVKFINVFCGELPQAGQMEREGRLSEAEQLFLLVNEPDQAISMYKKARQVSSLSLFLSQLPTYLIQTSGKGSS